MKHIANFLRNPIEFFKDERNQKILILSVFVYLFLWLLILLASGASHYGEEAVNLDNAAITSVWVTPGITPTKWWIKMTVMSSPTPSVIRTYTGPAGSSSAQSYSLWCPHRDTDNRKFFGIR